MAESTPIIRRLIHTLRFLHPQYAATGAWELWEAALADSGLSSWTLLPHERELFEQVTRRDSRPSSLYRVGNILQAVRLNSPAAPQHSGLMQPLPAQVSPSPLLAALAPLLGRELNRSPDAVLACIQSHCADLAWPEASHLIPYWVGAKIEVAATFCLEQGISPAPFRLVGGDISGIQRFIYTISSRGALKSLRARSMILELFSRSVAADIATRGAGVASEVYVGGGRLYCLIPEEPDTAQWLRELAQEWQEALYNTFRGRLGLALASVACSLDDLQTVGAEVWQKLQAELAQAKHRLFHDLLAEPSAWEPQASEAECQICRLPNPSARPRREWPWETPQEAATLWCDFCWNVFRLGGRLPHLVGVAETAFSQEPYNAIQIGGKRFVPVEDGEADAQWVKRADRVWVLSEAGLSIHPQARRLPITVLAAQDEEKNVLSFEEMGLSAQGVNRIGAARVDADNVGRIFAEGLPAAYRTLAHLASLSLAYEEFFARRLPAVLMATQKPDAPNLLTVIYSGGDDAFWVGPWNIVAESVLKVALAFEAYVGHNPDVTLSAGFTLAAQHFPVYHLAEVAGQAEEVSKTLRNAVTFWLEAPSPARAWSSHTNPATFPWEEAHHLYQAVLEPLLDVFSQRQSDLTAGPLPRAWLSKLLALSDSYLSEKRLPFAPLAWTLARTRDSLRSDTLRQEWMRWSRQFLEPDRLWKARPFLLWYDLLLRTREPKEES
ncbi:MAG: type III-A CRISPR-associated protein Cas10/Csm1 [Firmicutes bacterium]|nr:type III-A CRISPR-associated protein Cas10/Csm1 [Bacillota bacterium]